MARRASSPGASGCRETVPCRTVPSTPSVPARGSADVSADGHMHGEPVRSTQRVGWGRIAGERCAAGRWRTISRVPGEMYVVRTDSRRFLWCAVLTAQLQSPKICRFARATAVADPPAPLPLPPSPH